MNVEDIMSTEVVTVVADDTLKVVRDIFRQNNFHHLLVARDGKLRGVISDRDMLARLSPFLDTPTEQPADREVLRLTAADIMSADPISVDRDTSIDYASIILLENGISCLPVVNGDGTIEGILTWKDILKYHVYVA